MAAMVTVLLACLSESKKVLHAELECFLPFCYLCRECRERVMCVLQNTSHSKTTRDLELFQIRDKVKEKLTGTL